MKLATSFLLLAILTAYSQATYTMATVNGAPDPLESYPMNISTDAWADCVQLCYSNSGCYLAYGNGSICVLYMIGGVYKVRNDGAVSTNEVVSFKLDIPDGDCTGSAANAFEANIGKIGKYDVLMSNIDSFKVTVTPQFFEFDYTYKDNCVVRFNIGVIFDCPCTMGMYSFRGSVDFSRSMTPGPIQTWQQCVNYCLKEERCFVAAQNKYYGLCYMFEASKIDVIHHSDDASISEIPNFLAIKHIYEPDNCPGAEEQVFNRNGVVIKEILNSQYKTMDISKSGMTTTIQCYK